VGVHCSRLASGSGARPRARSPDAGRCDPEGPEPVRITGNEILRFYGEAIVRIALAGPVEVSRT